MATENNGVYFTELELKNVKSFGDEAVLKLSNKKGNWQKWNVILGDNGTGKTTLLQCLAGFELVTKKLGNDVKGYTDYWVPKMSMKNNEPFLRINKTTFHLNLTLYNYKYVNYHIGYSSNGINGQSGGTLLDNNNIFVIGYGASRRISFQIFSEKEFEPEMSATLYDVDAKLINTEEWLLQMEFAASRDSEIKDLAIKRRNLITQSLKNILPDITDIRFKDSINIDRPVPRLEFKTPYGWVGIRDLSYGYETVVAWIVDVAARMFKQYPNSENPLEEPVIILVDEIDLHLHPKWQRQIFDFLEERFPRAQFVVTAHSPLIVQSAPEDANIIVLRKELVGDEYVVKIDNDVESVRNWRIDQIMSSDIFGLNTSRNPDVEKQLLERQELLKRDDLNEEEKKRLDELNEMSYGLPIADSAQDIKAMEIIRKAADFLKKQQESK